MVEDVLFRKLDARISKGLLHVAEIAGLHGIPRPSVDLHLSQRELANIVGGSRESVRECLQKWKRAGLITLDKDRIVIRDIAAIERLV